MELDMKFEGYHWAEIVTYEDDLDEYYCMALIDDNTEEVVSVLYDLTCYLH